MSTTGYRIEHTRNRTSRASLVGDTILIRLARGLPPTEESKHIENLLRRMAKIQARLQSQPVIDPFRSLLNGSQSETISIGSNRTLTFEILPSRRFRASKSPSGWIIEKPENVDRKSFHRFMWKLLSMSESVEMERRVHEINAATLRLPVMKVNMKLTRSRWGSCSRFGVINLSTALIFVPEALQDYVIVHEIAHIKHADHSAKFWRTVESVMPDYKERLRKLREFRLPHV